MEKSREEMEQQVTEAVTKAVTRGVTILVSVAVTFVVMVVMLKFVWAWVIADLFPGAVEQGLISANLTWLATVKLAVFVSALSGAYHTLVDAFNPK